MLRAPDDISGILYAKLIPREIQSAGINLAGLIKTRVERAHRDASNADLTYYPPTVFHRNDSITFGCPLILISPCGVPADTTESQSYRCPTAIISFQFAFLPREYARFNRAIELADFSRGRVIGSARPIRDIRDIRDIKFTRLDNASLPGCSSIDSRSR